MLKPGCIEPVIYFVNGSDPAHPVGYVMLAPYSDCPTPEGYRREGADTLAQVDVLERRLQSQEREAADREMEYDYKMIEERSKAVRDRLYARMTSAATPPYEREFLRLYLELRDERKRARYQQLYLERSTYLWARHNDIGDRRADSEEFKAERHEVKS